MKEKSKQLIFKYLLIYYSIFLIINILQFFAWGFINLEAIFKNFPIPLVYSVSNIIYLCLGLFVYLWHIPRFLWRKSSFLKGKYFILPLISILFYIIALVGLNFSALYPLYVVAPLFFLFSFSPSGFTVLEVFFGPIISGLIALLSPFIYIYLFIFNKKASQKILRDCKKFWKFNVKHSPLVKIYRFIRNKLRNK